MPREQPCARPFFHSARHLYAERLGDLRRAEGPDAIPRSNAGHANRGYPWIDVTPSPRKVEFP
jgi:hypothetical protein